MLSFGSILFGFVLLVAFAQAAPRSEERFVDDYEDVTEDVNCRRTNEFCGEKRLVCRELELTITYYAIAPSRLEEYTFSYESCKTEAPEYFSFTKEFTNYVVQEQPSCEVSVRYTCLVTFNVIQKTYTKEFCVPEPQELEEITVPVTIDCDVTTQPRKQEITFVYTAIETDAPRRVLFTFTLDYEKPPVVRSVTRQVSFTVTVCQAPVLEQTVLYYEVAITRPPVKRTAVKDYSYYVTQEPVVRRVVFTDNVEYPGKPIYEKIVRRYSYYVTEAPQLVTYTERIRFLVAQKPEVTTFQAEIPYYCPGALVKKPEYIQFTYYPPAPLQSSKVCVSLTYYVTLSPKMEEYTEEVSASVYGPPIRSRKVMEYTQMERLAPKMETIAEFDYTSFLAPEEEITAVYIKYTSYCTKAPRIGYSVVPYTNVVYKPLCECDIPFTYASCVTSPPHEVTYCVTVTAYMEKVIEPEEFIERFTYFATCEPFTKRIPIPYTTFVKRCAV